MNWVLETILKHSSRITITTEQFVDDSNFGLITEQCDDDSFLRTHNFVNSKVQFKKQRRYTCNHCGLMIRFRKVSWGRSLWIYNNGGSIDCLERRMRKACE